MQDLMSLMWGCTRPQHPPTHTQHTPERDELPIINANVIPPISFTEFIYV